MEYMPATFPGWAFSPGVSNEHKSLLGVPLAHRIMWFAKSALEALEACHMIGYPHRDVKYGNMAVRVGGSELCESKVVLLDFGLTMTGDERGIGTRFLRMEDWFPLANKQHEDRGMRDRFAVGMTCVELAMHYTLYHDDNMDAWKTYRALCYTKGKSRKNKQAAFGNRFKQEGDLDGEGWLKFLHSHPQDSCHLLGKNHTKFCNMVATAMRDIDEKELGNLLNLSWPKPIRKRRR